MRHLSVESALFYRIITDGLLKLDTGDGIYQDILKERNFISLKRVYINGQYCDVKISNGKLSITKHE